MNNINEITEEIKNNTDEQLKDVIEKWYEKIHIQSMKLGASYISAAIFGVIQKHTKKAGKISLNDYKRMTAEIIKIISVQLTQQNDSEADTIKEDNTNEEIINEQESSI